MSSGLIRLFLERFVASERATALGIAIASGLGGLVVMGLTFGIAYGAAWFFLVSFFTGASGWALWIAIGLMIALVFGTPFFLVFGGLGVVCSTRRGSRTDWRPLEEGPGVRETRQGKGAEASVPPVWPRRCIVRQPRGLIPEADMVSCAPRARIDKRTTFHTLGVDDVTAAATDDRSWLRAGTGAVGSHVDRGGSGPVDDLAIGSAEQLRHQWHGDVLSSDGGAVHMLVDPRHVFSQSGSRGGHLSESWHQPVPGQVERRNPRRVEARLDHRSRYRRRTSA